jgi:hypothetical protein
MTRTDPHVGRVLIVTGASRYAVCVNCRQARDAADSATGSVIEVARGR